MTIDKDFWKKAYKDLWNTASSKEEFIKNLIEKETGLEVVPFGLGAESNQFISGSAEEHNKEKGAPDYHIKGTNIYIEVTGPISDRPKPEAGLWLRPDKLNYVYKHLKDQDEFFALHFSSTGDWFSIHATKDFIEVAKSYKTAELNIRGNKERYEIIPYESPYVKPLQAMIDYLKNIEIPE